MAYHMVDVAALAAGQALTNEGGLAFVATEWARLRRFLILGTDLGTYYATPQALTVENASVALDLIKKDGKGVVREVLLLSTENRAPKQDAGLFVLAMAARYGDKDTRIDANAALPRVARTFSTLFLFLSFYVPMKKEKGFGRSLRRAISSFYNDVPARTLAFNVGKYGSRNGWSHKNLLSLAHVKPVSPDHDKVFFYCCNDDLPQLDDEDPSEVRELLEATKAVKTNPALSVSAIIEHGLVREHLSTDALNDPLVWQALLVKMPITALIRNINKITALGLLDDPETLHSVCDRITDPKVLRGGRVHPIKILIALNAYSAGKGNGKLEWIPHSSIKEAFDKAFYIAFKSVPAIISSCVVSVDVSGSMHTAVSSTTGLSARQVAAALAMLFRRNADDCIINAFSTTLVPIDIKPSDKLQAVIEKMSTFPFSGTDCSLPMMWARTKKHPCDVFVVITDNETGHSKYTPAEALALYNETMGINAKLIVLAVTSTSFTIADPANNDMLDIAGFDSSVLDIIVDFIEKGL
jgi:60 kDa SS-A/Ro ribonucleoprotein